MTSIKGVKRFIAGAVCPACGLSEKIYVQRDQSGESRHCVSCGFEERKPEDPLTSNPGEWSSVRLPDK